MKITSVECYLGTGAIGGFVTMKINTDSGIYGWGEAGLAYGKSAEAAFGQCQDFGKLILGMDPFNTEEIWGAPASPHLLGYGRRRRYYLRHGCD